MPKTDTHEDDEEITKQRKRNYGDGVETATETRIPEDEAKYLEKMERQERKSRSKQ